MMSATRFMVAAIGAVSAGAAAARLRARSRRPAEPIAVAPPAPPAAAPAADDPQAAIDAARSRLRSEAETLREEIERGP